MKPDPELVQLASELLKRAASDAQDAGIDAEAVGLAALDLAGFVLLHSIGQDKTRELFGCCVEWLDSGKWDRALPGTDDPPSGLVH